MSSRPSGFEDRRWHRLVEVIGGYPSALVAFSGGMDSSFLLFAAHRVLGKHALGVMAVSPAVPPWDLEDARMLRDVYGLPVRFIPTDVVENEKYAENSPLRCYYCKEDLYRRLREIRDRENWGVIFNGTVTDDLGDYRPGLKAAQEAEVVSPFVEAGLGKRDIRELAASFNLPFSDRPPSPCLASRIPYGHRVTVPSLRRVAAAERALRALGFREVRVRHLGDTARVELGQKDRLRLDDNGVHTRLVSAVLTTGFTKVIVADYKPSGLHAFASEKEQA